MSRLEKQGVVTMNYGGATLNEGAAVEPSFHLKSGYSQDAKDQVAYEAAQMVNDGDSIIIDSGTTTMRIAKYLYNKRIKVLINSWKVIQYLHDYPKIEVILAPGIYNRVSEGALSSATIEFIRKYNVDKAFLSAQGIDVNAGASVPSDNDALVKQAFIQAARHRILLCDHTKIGQVFLAKIADIEDFDAIILDVESDDSFIKEAKKKNANISIAHSLLKQGRIE